MRVQQGHFLLFIVITLITACSGGSDKDTVSEEKFDPNATSLINGTISLDKNFNVDSDLNDLNTESLNNSSFSLAQDIQTFATVQGFASKVATRLFENEREHKRTNDRFYSSADEYDFFKTWLHKGQTIQLQTVNSNFIESDDIFSGDIDLYLYNTNYAIIDYSDSLTEFDSITVPENDFYYIKVHANKGASKYLLRLLPGSSTPEQNLSAPTSKQKATLDFVPNELIVQFSDQQAMATTHSALAYMKTNNSGRTKPTLAKFSDTYSSAVATNQAEALKELASLNPESYDKLLTLYKRKTLQALPHVKSASLNYRRYPLRTPNDPLYARQWHYPAINLPEAWNITTGTPATGDVIVAVIDSGIFSNHPDLRNKLVSGYDFVSDPFNSSDNEPGSTNPNSDIDDNPEDIGMGWHGTHVAGTIGAETNNNYGVAGVSWGAKIMPLRALGILGGTSYDLMEALRFAAGLENDSGTIPPKAADIINLSIGGYSPNSEEEALLSEIYDLGIIVVASAGNESSSIPSYPAAYNHVISVSALDFNANLAPYSNFGSTIDIAAPGGDLSNDYNQDNEDDGVLSTLVDDSTGANTADFALYEGTSMAAPHVSGMFALMKAVYPDLDATKADTLLKSDLLTNDIGAAGKDTLFGHGAADALKAALALNAGGSLPTLPISMLATPSNLSFSGFDKESLNTLEATITILNEGAVNAQVSSVSSNLDWLTVLYTENQDNGLGSYLVSINPNGLLTNSYQGSLTFNITNAETNKASSALIVPISLSIYDMTYTSKIAEMNIYLHDQTSFELVRQTKASIDSSSLNSQLQFSLDRIKAGNYFLYASTDIDNDSKICTTAEACASYPYIEKPQVIQVEDDSTFNVELNARLLHFNYSDNIINNLEEDQPSATINADSLRQAL